MAEIVINMINQAFCSLPMPNSWQINKFNKNSKLIKGQATDQPPKGKMLRIKLWLNASVNKAATARLENKNDTAGRRRDGRDSVIVVNTLDDIHTAPGNEVSCSVKGVS